MKINWVEFKNLKHHENTYYKEGNFENAFTSVAAVALLCGYILPMPRGSIFLILG